MLDWIKEHPYLSGGVVIGLLVLYLLYQSSVNASAANSTAAATSNASGAPDDTIQAAEISAGTQVATAQLASNTAIAQYNEQANQNALASATAEYQASAGVEQNNQNTQAQLTLGLANAGQSTNSILELLGGQPGASAVTQQLVVSGVGESTPASSIPSNAGTPAITVSGSGGSSAGTSSGSGSGATTSATPVTGAIDPSDVTSVADLYETGQSTMDTETGQAVSGVNPDYLATPQAAGALASILGTTTGNAGPVGGVGASGGPFVNPSATGIYVPGNSTTALPGGSPAGITNAGQFLSELQGLPETLWGQIAQGYGINLSSGEETDLEGLINSGNGAAAA